METAPTDLPAPPKRPAPPVGGPRSANSSEVNDAAGTALAGKPANGIPVLPIVALVVLLAVLGASAAFLVLRGDSTYTLTGTYVVWEEDQKASGSCTTISRGYQDVGTGTDVVVSIPDGSEVAFGSLESGFATTPLEELEATPAEALGGDAEKRELTDLFRESRSLTNNGCLFEWEVTGIPQGERYYLVTIGRNRGEIRIEAEDMDKPQRQTLGDMLEQ